MANPNRPRGFQFAKTTHGRSPQMRKYLSDGAVAIYEGDVLDIDTEGHVASVTSTEDEPIGVAASAQPTTGDTTAEVWVYDDLANTVFVAQCDGADILGDSQMYSNCGVLTTAGSTATAQSVMEIDSSQVTSTIGLAVLLLRRVENPQNEWGGNVDLECQFIVDEFAIQRDAIAT